MTNEVLSRRLDISPDNIAEDLGSLYESFTGYMYPSKEQLELFADVFLDFRNGRPREDTPWTEGRRLTVEQKRAVLDIADKWQMNATSEPIDDYDQIIVPGAHNYTLGLRINRAIEIERNRSGNMPDLTILSCYRPVHPKEQVDDAEISTECDLSIRWLERSMGDEFKPDGVSVWNDQPDGPLDINAQAVAYSGRTGRSRHLVIAGSPAPGYYRATTSSTLNSLRSILEDARPRLLFVTSSLHLPYQLMQIEKAMDGFQLEAVGVKYEWLGRLSLESDDSNFRVVLQEIGATVKNCLQDNVR